MLLIAVGRGGVAVKTAPTGDQDSSVSRPDQDFVYKRKITKKKLYLNPSLPLNRAATSLFSKRDVFFLIHFFIILLLCQLCFIKLKNKFLVISGCVTLGVTKCKTAAAGFSAVIICRCSVG